MQYFGACLQKAAEQALTRIPAEQNKEYISERTWNLMESRQSAKQSGNADLAQSLNDEIRKAVQQDKLAHLKAELEELKDQKHQWTGWKLKDQKYQWTGLKKL